MIAIAKKMKIIIGIIALLVIALLVYRLSPYKLEFLGYYDKIWAHRANSIEKLHSALDYYKGVELDLVYHEQENFLDVNHPPTTSIHLEFENYIATLDKEEYPFLWLDIKNLREDTAKSIFTKLQDVFAKVNYPLQNVLIETRYPEALPMFSEAGYKTSYYLPAFLVKRDSVLLEKTIERVKKTLKEQPNIAISTSHKDYHIVKEHFPEHRKYIWVLVPVVNIDFFTTREILKDETVEVVLVKYVALKGNR